MTREFKWTLSDGRAAKIVATYEETMQRKTTNLDGHEFVLDAEPKITERNMVLYVDGEKIESCWDNNFWKLVDVFREPELKRIWGLSVCFYSENAARYEAFLSELIEAGTSEEVKAYRNAKETTSQARIKKPAGLCPKCGTYCHGDCET